MANHGQLLEYSLDPVPDQTISKDKVCESSPIDMNIVAFGQWNLAKSGGKERTEVSPPLEPANPLLISKELLGSQEEPWPEDDSEDRWLSQVEIVTHIGPARRLWMGPQFSFRTFQHMGQSEDDLADMDVTVTTRPQQSEPMQMPGGANPLQKPPVFIECGSANSFELSPRFANLAIRGSREHVSLDVESELREAMSDTVQKTADGREEHPSDQRGEEDSQLERDLAASQSTHLDKLVRGGVVEDGGDGDGRDEDILRRRLSGQGGELLKFDAQRCHEGR
jgi:hypothetical protein